MDLVRKKSCVNNRSDGSKSISLNSNNNHNIHIDIFDNHRTKTIYIKWLEILLLIIMWTHKRCYKLIEIIGCIFIFILTILYAYFTYYDDIIEKVTFEMFSLLDFGAFGIARICLLYYFIKEFKKYPWSNLTKYYHN